jgi:phosphoribosyl 1,2-cyclic phosphodiesterase
MLSVRFWGVRGSIPCPGPDTVIYGGNTSCLEIRADERLIIIDLGTGVRPLGEWLAKNDLKKNGKISADIFLTHTHWDHIMGFPMFTPIFIPSTKIRIMGPVSFDDNNLESIISSQLSYQYWPVRQSELAAKIDYKELKETTIDMGEGLKVTTKYLNHPLICLGYRFEYQGKTIVTAFDHEPFRNLFPTDPADPNYNEEAALEGEATVKEENERVLQFYNGADILVLDTQYTTVEFEKHLGWGHSSYEYAIEAASKAKVRKLILFHHDPNNTDERLETLEAQYKNEVEKKSSLEITMAREGAIIEA